MTFLYDVSPEYKGSDDFYLSFSSYVLIYFNDVDY